MDWLNYHHLLYFWTVAREGTVARAAKALKLTQPTISGQIRTLELALGEKLFVRAGRRLVLTDVGRVVFRYADEIFGIGRELMDAVKGLPTGRPLKLRVGIADVVPKLIAHRVLAPALETGPGVQLSVVEDTTELLLAALSVHELDLVLLDTPVRPSATVRAFSHLMGECGVTVFGTAALVRRHRGDFPRSLDGAPFLLPTENTALRRALSSWFDSERVRPRIVAEFDDSALIQVFGQNGAGLFVAPSAIEADMKQQYGVEVVGRTSAVTERYFAVSVERRIKHPVVAQLLESTRATLFS